MKKIIFSVFLILTVTNAWSIGPLFRHKDKAVNQEVENVYRDLAGKQNSIPSYTKAQLLQLIPPKTNLLYICSDCSTTSLVISTGTVAGAVGVATAKTTAIN